MKDIIKTCVKLYIDDVELNLYVKEDLKREEGVLKNFGNIEITDGRLETKPIFWDGIDFFLKCDKKTFKKECKEELVAADYDWRKVYKIIKTLLKRAKKLKIIE
jgi:hypothetical protein